MAYTHTTPHDLGLSLADLGVAGPALQAASKVIQDPALPQITCEVLRLNKAVEGKDPGPPCASRVFTPAEKRKGVGLHVAVKPLKIVTWARTNPALAIGAAVGVVGVIWWAGYAMGKAKRR